MAAAASPPADSGQRRREVVPRRLWPWVKRCSWAELAVFAGLLVVWAIPGLEYLTFLFGLGHGLGFVALAVLIWIAVMRRESPYWLLAATLTPVGPLGSVIGIELLERRYRREEKGEPKPATGVESGR